MTFDHDPDREIDAWLDEGPRSFSPRLLDRTLADIHASPQQRRRFAPWRPLTMNLTFKTGLAGVIVLALVLGTGALLPWFPRLAVEPGVSPSPSPVTSPSPSSFPFSDPVFVPGDAPLVGTTWLLVGRNDAARAEGDPAYISPVPGAPPATLRFLAGGGLVGSTGCRAITGSYDAEPQGSRTVPADLALDPMDGFACEGPLGTQDLEMLADLENAGALGITALGYDALASELTDADLDATLLAHYQAWPALRRLVIRDQSGEGSLVYAPVRPEPDPAQVLVGPRWGLIGYLADDGFRVVEQASAAVIEFAADGTFAGSPGCGSVRGTWADPTATEADPPGDLDVKEWQTCAESAQADTVGGLLQQVDLAAGITLTEHPLDQLPDVPVESFLQGMGERGGVEYLLLRDQTGRVILIYTALASAGG